jgi:hypothetical protein
MTPKTTRTTTALIVATFALVGLLTTGAVVVPAAFAQTANGIRDGPETTRETTEQTEDQSEQNTQASSIDQDQTAAINEEIASGEGSEVGSAANSESESTYETKYKSKYKSKYGSGSSIPIPGESIAASDSTSDVSNNGTLGQDQVLSSPVQVNDNQGGNDQSRSAVVDFGLGYEQFTEQTESATPDVGTRVPIVIP